MERPQSYDHLISTLRFPVLVRRPIYIESGLGYSMGPPVHCQFLLGKLSRERPGLKGVLTHCPLGDIPLF